MAEDDGLDAVLDRLRERGGRVTTARRAILAAVFAAGGHVTAEEIADRVQRDHPDVHLSTVYRTLEALTELGVVAHVHLGHGAAVYHFADRDHEHLVCEVCGRVVGVPDDAVAGFRAEVARRLGFELGRQHFALTGRCPSCAAQGAVPDGGVGARPS